MFSLFLSRLRREIFQIFQIFFLGVRLSSEKSFKSFQILQNLFIIYLFDLFRFVEFLLEEHSLQKLYFIDVATYGIAVIPFGVETFGTEIDEHAVRLVGDVHVVPQLTAVLGVDVLDGL